MGFTLHLSASNESNSAYNGLGSLIRSAAWRRCPIISTITSFAFWHLHPPRRLKKSSESRSNGSSSVRFFPVLRRRCRKKSMPLIPRSLDNHDFMTLAVRDRWVKTLGTDLLWGLVNGGISMALVLLGGFFAGLTLAYVTPASNPSVGN